MRNRTFRRSAAALTVGYALTAIPGYSATENDDWEFALSPLFLWGVSLEGDATIDGNTAPLDLSFKDDILENLEAVFTLHFEARKGNWSFFTEYQFIDLEPEVDVMMGPITVNADVDFEEHMWELGAGWAFSESERTRQGAKRS